MDRHRLAWAQRVEDRFRTQTGSTRARNLTSAKRRKKSYVTALITYRSSRESRHSLTLLAGPQGVISGPEPLPPPDSTGLRRPQSAEKAEQSSWRGRLE